MKRFIVMLCGLMLAALTPLPVLAAGDPVVHSVYLYTPDNADCRTVTVEVLTGLRARYGSQLNISMLDVQSDQGVLVYPALAEKYGLPQGSQNGPVVLVGDKALTGVDDIRAQYDGLIEAGIQAGGVAWPDVPGLQGALVEDTVQLGGDSISATDAIANDLAVVVLAVMAVSVVWQGFRRDWFDLRVKQYKNNFVPKAAGLIPWLVPVGLVISGYLSYVELTASQAVCGPLGNCNAVQTSTYARLFGILPVGVLGFLGNLCILGGWIFKYYGAKPLRIWAAWALAGFAAFGILFSIYLTTLEPFVIHATCAWCLGSAVLMTVLFWLVFETTWEKPKKVKKH